MRKLISQWMSNRPETPSSASPGHIDGDSFPSQKSSHGQREGLAAEEMQIAPISKATFNTHNTSGPVTNVNGNIYYAASAAPDNLDIHLDYSARARFDCQDRTSCTDRTRIDVIERIETWANNGPPVFWLNGSAGTGKSTIAFTVAKSFKSRRVLGASFFCSRDDATCSNHKLIFPTIAHQLARFHPEFRRRLADAVKEEPDIVHSDVAYQLQELIVKPLGCTRDFPSSCVVVVDALDECKDDSTISVILAALSRHVENLAPLKIFLTSRPERNINLGFSDSILHGTTRRFILHEIKLSTVEADIKTCIVAQLEVVRREYGIDQSWPFDVEVDSLSTMSCGLFIFAATAIKFIQDRNYDDPQGQLTRIILNTTPLKDEDSDPLHRLDQLYMQVLMNAHPKPSPELAERLRLLLGTIVLLQDPLSFHAIQQLLKHEPVNRFEAHSMRQTLMRLHSIILVPEGDHAIIRTLHPSFFDFITSPDRCSISRLLVDTSQQHTLLLAACLRTMQGLKCNICELPDPSVLNNEIADLPSRIAKFIPPEQQYACRHWGTHLRYAVISEDIWKLLLWFCSEHMLFWVEACSLLGDLRNQLVLLDGAQRTLAEHVQQDSATTMTLLHECGRLIRNFFPAISTAWAHVYDSALTFAPQGSALRKCYSPQIRVIGGLQEWKPLFDVHSGVVLSAVYSPDGTRIASGCIDGTIRLCDSISAVHFNTLEGHSNGVYSVVFSPDGADIASGSGDKTIRLWDAVTGKHLMTLEGHSSDIKSVAYSPNGTRIASGSIDRTVVLWDAKSGVHLNTIKGHSSSVNSVAFSPDGNILASISGHNVIRLWDAVSGKQLSSLIGPRSHITSMAYSPDGTRIASGSLDRTIRLWDVIGGACLHTLKGHSNGVYSVVFSPDGAKIASGSSDKTIRLWDAVSGKHLVTLEGHSGGVTSVAISPDGNHMVSGSEDKTTRLWSTRQDSQTASLFLPTVRDAHSSDADPLFISFSPDASSIVSASLSMPGFLTLQDAVSGAHQRSLHQEMQKLNIHTLAFSHDGTRIVCVSPHGTWMHDIVGDNTIKIVISRPPAGRPRVPGSFATFSPDDTCIASGYEDGKIRLWSVVSGARVKNLKGHQERVVSMQFSPEGTRIASGSASDIQLWDVRSGTQLVTVKMENSRLLRSIAFSPEGNRLIVAISYGAHWDLELRGVDGEVLTVIKSHAASPALWLPFSPEHRDLANDDNSTRQWAQAHDFTAQYTYFLQGGWVWLAHPRRRLCWVPVACRGSRFVSSNSRIAFGTDTLGIVIINFSEVLLPVNDEN